MLVAQSNDEALADKRLATDTAADKSSSSRSTSVAVKGYLNYKATHHEGKVAPLVVT